MCGGLGSEGVGAGKIQANVDHIVRLCLKNNTRAKDSVLGETLTEHVQGPWFPFPVWGGEGDIDSQQLTRAKRTDSSIS